MNRYLIFAALSVFMFMASALGLAAPPNIMLIVADDLSWHDAGCYGNAQVHTPNLDALAAQGMRFDNCFTATAMCGPTRQQLYTGVFPVRNGAYPNHSHVKNGTRSIVHHLDDIGYRVALIGKQFVGPQSAFPYEYLGETYEYLGKRKKKSKGTVKVDAAVRIDAAARVDGDEFDMTMIGQFVQRQADQPFCLIVCSHQPHGPWSMGDRSAYDPAKLTLPPYILDNDATRQALVKYYAEVTYLDLQVGRLMKLLDDSGRADDTIVLFTSEQGSAFPFAKFTCYDAGLKTMLIACWPGHVKAGSTTSAMVQYVDVLPTLVEAAGGDPKTIDTGLPGDPNGGHGFDGSSFLQVLLGQAEQHDDVVFGVQTTQGTVGGKPFPIRSARSDRYLYILNPNHDNPFFNRSLGGPAYDSWRQAAEHGDANAKRLVDSYEHRPEVELYDVVEDPYQQHNIAGPEHRAVMDQLRARLDAWMEQQGDEGMATELKVGSRKKK